MRRQDGDLGLAVILAIQLATIFVVAPLAATGTVSIELIEMLRFGLAATTILILAKTMISRGLIALAFLATLAATLQWRIGEPASIVAALKILVTLGFDSIVAAMVAMAAFGPGRVTVHRILGAVILYLYAALIFAGIYRLGALLHPASFRGLSPDPRAQFSDLLYFSLGTLTTGGTGDVLPLHPLLRGFSSLENVIGQLFPATLLARLVTLHAAAEAARIGAGAPSRKGEEEEA